MNPYLKYLGYVVRHKRFVYQEGRKLGVPRLQLLLHDLHKLLPDEFLPYARLFNTELAVGERIEVKTGTRSRGGVVRKIDGDVVVVLLDRGGLFYCARKAVRRTELERLFDLAWLKHQRRSLHHWQAWVLFKDDGGLKTLSMPDHVRREMLADWRGAGRAITGVDDTRSWYLKTAHNMRLHPETKAWLEAQLGIAPERLIKDTE